MALLTPRGLKFVRDHSLIHISWSPVPNADKYLLDVTFQTTSEHRSYVVPKSCLTVAALKYERCTAQVTAKNDTLLSKPSYVLVVEPLSELSNSTLFDFTFTNFDFSVECGPRQGHITLKWSAIPLSCQYKIQRTDMNYTSIDNECITIIGKNQISIYEDRPKCDLAELCCMGHYYSISILNKTCQILTTKLSKKVFCIPSSMVKEVIPLPAIVPSKPSFTNVEKSSTTVVCQVRSWLKKILLSVFLALALFIFSIFVSSSKDL
jgi:hypothetical protein